MSSGKNLRFSKSVLQRKLATFNVLSEPHYSLQKTRLQGMHRLKKQS